eukprot:c47325_g1_i1.p1 GENE.c47325_g1_i1~~c47325_g1_i1.p1  ORF type:complete len:250 (+),score=53.81 c47325_g1_i1:37-750(+)
MCQNCGWGCSACCTTVGNIIALILFLWALVGVQWLVSFNVTVGLSKLELYSFETRNGGGSSGNNVVVTKGTHTFDGSFCKANADRKKLCDLFKEGGTGAAATLALGFICGIFALVLTIIFLLPEASCSCIPAIKPGGNLTAIIAGALEFSAVFFAAIALIIYSRKTAEIRRINAWFFYYWNFYLVIIGVIMIGISAIIHMTLGTCATGTRSMSSSQYRGGAAGGAAPASAAPANDKL